MAQYLELTRRVMPDLAQDPARRWPVRFDHCFQRIVLDTVCGGVWYDYLSRPAYRHLTSEQAGRAVKLCEDIISGAVDLDRLNATSLAWRGKSEPRRR